MRFNWMQCVALFWMGAIAQDFYVRGFYPDFVKELLIVAGIVYWGKLIEEQRRKDVEKFIRGTRNYLAKLRITASDKFYLELRKHID